MLKSAPTFIITLLVAAIFTTEISSNIYVPSLPFLVDYFNVGQQDVSLTISINLLGLCLAGIFYGPLSDSFGRRPIFIIGMSLFTLGTLACATADSITTLVIARFVQGLGGAVSCIVGILMIKDKFDDAQCTDVLSAIYFVIALSPAMAPILGGYISETIGWRINFYMMGIFSTLVVAVMIWKMPETHEVAERTPFRPQIFFQDYWMVLTNPFFLGYALISALTYAGLWAYISGVPYIFMNIIGLSSAEFGYVQAFLVAAYLIGSYVNKKLFVRLGTHILLCSGVSLTFCGGIGLMLAWYFEQQTVISIIGPMFIFAVGMGGIFSNTVTKALYVFPKLRGSASATLSSLEALIPVITTYLVGAFYDETLWSTAVVVFGCSSLTILIYMGLYIWPQKLDPQQQPINYASS